MWNLWTPPLPSHHAANEHTSPETPQLEATGSGRIPLASGQGRSSNSTASEVLRPRLKWPGSPGVRVINEGLGKSLHPRCLGCGAGLITTHIVETRPTSKALWLGNWLLFGVPSGKHQPCFVEVLATVVGALASYGSWFSKVWKTQSLLSSPWSKRKGTAPVETTDRVEVFHQTQG